MAERLTMSLHNAQQAHQAIQTAWAHAKAWLCAGDQRLTLEIRPEKRSDAENRMLHSMLGHISKTHEWAGKKHSIDVWKRLLTAAWCRATGEPVELLPALDGNGVDIVFKKTSQLSRKECADLIEFIFAWSADNGIELPHMD